MHLSVRLGLSGRDAADLRPSGQSLSGVLFNVSLSMYIHIYIYMCVYIYIYIYMSISLSLYIYIHTCIFI